jgi:hypothetical protein
MSRRARSATPWWVGLVLLLAAAPVHAQQQPGTRRLEELRGQWKKKTEEYARGRAAIDASAARLAERQRAHDAQREALRAAEQAQQDAWTPWGKLLARRQVEVDKRDLRVVSDELEREKQEGDRLRSRVGVLRLELVQTGRTLYERLIERADELRLNERGKQADEYYAEAMRDLELVEDLEAAEPPPLPAPDLPELQEEVRERSTKELEQLAEFYSELQAEAQTHLAGLLPEEQALTQRLRHLERLSEARVVLPTLPERRERAARALERFASLRQALELRAQRYGERVAALQEVIRVRALEESERERAREGGG